MTVIINGGINVIALLIVIEIVIIVRGLIVFEIVTIGGEKKKRVWQ